MDIKAQVKAFKKELIIKKAAELFAKEGFSAVKMADIAKACNVAVGTIYKLFASKEELFFAYVQYEIDRFYDRLLQDFQTHKTPKERLAIFVDRMIEAFLDKKKVLTDTIAGDPLFFAKLNLTHQNPAQKIYNLLEKEFAKLPLKIDSPQKAAILFKSFIYGYIEYWLLFNEDIQHSSHEALNIFFCGIIKDETC